MTDINITLTKSTADLLMAIISAIIAALTYVASAISPTDPVITYSIILGAVITFLTAILNFSRKQEVSPTA